MSPKSCMSCRHIEEYENKYRCSKGSKPVLGNAEKAFGKCCEWWKPRRMKR